MKNLSFYITLLILIAAACNNESSIPPHSNPDISIENQQEILEVYPLDTINLNVTASTTSDQPISSFTSYNDCIVKLSNDPDNVYQDQYTYQFQALAPYEAGDQEISITAFTDKGETSEITQTIRVLEAPFTIDIDSTNVPTSAVEGSTFIVTGTIKSKIPFNSITFNSSVIEGGFTAVDDNIAAQLPHAARTGFNVNSHSYTLDDNGYSIYQFNTTFTVTAVHDEDVPQFANEFEFSIGYNFYNLNQDIKCSSSPRFGTWTKTVQID